MPKKRGKTKEIADIVEYDVSMMDPSLFEDPVLLLEYLQKQDVQSARPENETRVKQKAILPSKTTIHELPSSRNDKVSRNLIYGYELKNGEICIVQKEAEAVNVIFSLYEEGYGCIQISDEMRKTLYRTKYGKYFYPAAIKTIIDNQSVYQGNTDYPSILKNKPVSKSIVKRIESNKQPQSIMWHENPSSSDRTKDDPVLFKVERALLISGKELSLTDIKQRTGIGDSDCIIEALDNLIRSRKVIREWSRKHGGRSVYRLNKEYVSESSKQIVEVGNSKRSSNTEQQTVKINKEECAQEVLNILRMAGIPMNAETIKRKSALFDTVEICDLENIIFDLYRNGKVKKLDVVYKKAPLFEFEECSGSNIKEVLSKSNEMSKTSSDMIEQSPNNLQSNMKNSIQERSVAPHKKYGIDENQILYGYELKDGEIVVAEKEAFVVRKVFEMYGSEPGISSNKIAEILNKDGFRTRTGCIIRPNLVLRIWRDREVYLGIAPKVANYPKILLQDPDSTIKAKEKLHNNSEAANEKINESITKEKTVTSVNEKIETLLISVLCSNRCYLSLSEIYKCEPELKKYKRREILSTILELIRKSIIIRKMDSNSFGAAVLKYRINR